MVATTMIGEQQVKRINGMIMTEATMNNKR